MNISARILRKQIRTRISSIYSSSEADQVSALIIEHHFGISSTKQLLDQELIIPANIEEKINLMIRRLLHHEPIQYVLGRTAFYGYQFKTDSRALIPRPETEELVQLVLDIGLSKNSTVLDIGTGSGCIAIALALETGARVYALDSEPAALDLARENAQQLGAMVQFIQSDIMTSPPDLPMFDILVSNPPYVPARDLGAIESRVKNFEPQSALFVPDDDPLMFYIKIVELAPQYLKPGGSLFLEIYHTAGPAIMKLFQGPNWSQVTIKKDLQGKERMVMVSYLG